MYSLNQSGLVQFFKLGVSVTLTIRLRLNIGHVSSVGTCYDDDFLGLLKLRVNDLRGQEMISGPFSDI